jgi:hypothetical protein
MNGTLTVPTKDGGSLILKVLKDGRALCEHVESGTAEGIAATHMLSADFEKFSLPAVKPFLCRDCLDRVQTR